MSTPTLFGTAALLLLTFASGYWLARFRSAYPTSLLTVHKLAGLVAAGLFDFALIRSASMTQAALAAGLAANVFVVVLVVTGGLLSAEKGGTGALKLAHKISPWLAVASAAAALYFLSR